MNQLITLILGVIALGAVAVAARRQPKKQAIKIKNKP